MARGFRKRLSEIDKPGRIVNVTATATLNDLVHSERIVTVNAAAGLTLTLPAATGSGAKYSVYIGTTVTSNSVVVKVANATDVFRGRALTAQDAGDTIVAFETASTSDTITLNGTTTGGTEGDMIEIIDVASGKFYVAVYLTGTSTEATPFSATV